MTSTVRSPLEHRTEVHGWTRLGPIFMSLWLNEYTTDICDLDAKHCCKRLWLINLFVQNGIKKVKNWVNQDYLLLWILHIFGCLVLSFSIGAQRSFYFEIDTPHIRQGKLSPNIICDKTEKIVWLKIFTWKGFWLKSINQFSFWRRPSKSKKKKYF